jgi:flavin reductase (DIM6/NTAB) family NADH-FMN oxidoreductase RutF
MVKITLPPQAFMVMRPILLAGANAGGKPNFMEVGSGMVLSSDPPMVELPIRFHQLTLSGILENRTFSVNLPSVDNAKELDYCGMVSGRDTDKVKDCNFTVFYGKLGTAPMIEQFPVNLECRLLHILSSNIHAIVIGQIEATYVSEEYMTDGKPDAKKINPLVWFAERGEYLALGKTVGKSRGIGNEVKKIKR